MKNQSEQEKTVGKKRKKPSNPELNKLKRRLLRAMSKAISVMEGDDDSNITLKAVNAVATCGGVLERVLTDQSHAQWLITSETERVLKVVQQHVTPDQMKAIVHGLRVER